jgi:hypothetical protein
MIRILVGIFCLMSGVGFALPNIGTEGEHMLLNLFKAVDLTHPLCSNVPTWNGSCGFCLETKKDYDQVFRVQQMKMHAAVGTHMDAPSHRIQGGLSISELLGL